MLREEIANLKLKLKESQFHKDNFNDNEQVLNEMKSKVEKLQGKNQTLTRSLE